LQKRFTRSPPHPFRHVSPRKFSQSPASLGRRPSKLHRFPISKDLSPLEGLHLASGHDFRSRAGRPFSPAFPAPLLMSSHERQPPSLAPVLYSASLCSPDVTARTRILFLAGFPARIGFPSYFTPLLDEIPIYPPRSVRPRFRYRRRFLANRPYFQGFFPPCFTRMILSWFST